MYISSCLALLLSLATAQHAPVGTPTGNPFIRPLNENVPSCRPFTVAWQPTTPNTVSLLLLQGPPTNIKPISTMATGIANSGSFTWTPSGSLEATSTALYGLQLIDDITGQYQYSTQFGLSKGPECDNSTASSASSSLVSASSTGITVSSSSPSASSTPSTLPAAAASSASLSTGIKVGIALGAIFGVALVALVVYLAYYLGKRKRQHPKPEATEDKLEGASNAEEVAELHHDDVRELHNDNRCELDNDERRELDGLPVSELATPAAELEAKL